MIFDVQRFPAPTKAAVRALAPTGTLRAAINLSNFLLVSHTSSSGVPVGVSPDMATALANRLGVPVELRTYPNPGDVADAAGSATWDIGNIGAEPARAKHIDFSPAYAEIECTYLVPPGSTIKSFDDIDQPGIKVSVKARAAYALWLERNLRHAELVESDSLDSSFTTFVELGLDALAGLRPRLAADLQQVTDGRILDGKFSAVQQAIGTPVGRDPAGIGYLRRFVAAACSNGFVSDRIAAHDATGLSAAAGIE